MQIKPFKLERYFARYEFSAPYLLSSSDCEAVTLSELLVLADDESLALWDTLKLGYTESQGLPLLRETVTGLYSRVTEDDVLILTPEEGVFVAMNVLLRPGDHIITTFPGYQSLYEIAAAIGCDISRWMPTASDSWTFAVAQVVSLIRPNTRLIVMNFPHNPTGALLDRDAFEQVIGLAQERDIYVFSDEMYRLLEHDPQATLPAAADLYDKAVSLFGMSKTFGLPGLRIGWLATRDRELYGQLLSFKDYTTICSSAPSELLALMGLRARNTLIARNRDLIQQNLVYLETFFTRHADIFQWIKPRAGSIAFAKLRLPEDVESFCVRLVEESGIMLLPATVYDFEGNYFRVGYGRRSLPDILERLDDYLIQRA